MARKPAQNKTGSTIISKSSGREVDRKRSLAARKAAATRKANESQARERVALRLHHKILATGGIIAVVVAAAIGIHAEVSTYAATQAKVSQSALGFKNGGGKCMDNAGGIKKGGNPIRLYSCNASKAQTWSISGGYIKNANGYCLDTPGTKPKVGDDATLRECGSGAEMRWNYSKDTIKNQASGLCLGASGTKLELQNCKTTTSTYFNDKNQKVSTSLPVTTQKFHYQVVTASVEKNGPADNNPTVPKGVNGKPLSAKQQLARSIMNSGKVSFISVSGVSAGARKKIFTDIATGRTSGNSLPCGLNIRVLKVVKRLVDKHKSVTISDTNSLCNGLNIRSLGSRHYYGNGSALDIAAVDGVSLNGSNAKSISVLKEIKSLLLTGSSLHNRSQVGQSNCRRYLDLGKVSQFSDSCNHVHIDFPPWSDPSLKYKSGAY